MCTFLNLKYIRCEFVTSVENFLTFEPLIYIHELIKKDGRGLRGAG